MLFYKVKKEADNIPLKSRLIYIGGELATESEIKRYKMDKKHMTPVNISKRRTYWFWGARFECKLPIA